jgi:hypothetical protein
VCSKGLCPECVADFDTTIGCKGRHEELAGRIAISQARVSRATFILPVFLIVMGTIFVAWGLLSRPLSVFTALLGIGFMSFGLLLLKKGARPKAE